MLVESIPDMQLDTLKRKEHQSRRRTSTICSQEAEVLLDRQQASEEEHMRQEFETTSSRQLVTVFEFMIRKSFEKQYHYIGTELSRQLL